jgi:hypothetical protein
VYEANVTGADDGVPYTGVYVPAFDPLGSYGRKAVHMVRAVLRSRYLASERLSVHADYVVSLPTPPSSVGLGESSTWGAGIWGISTWADASLKNTVQKVWRNVFGDGDAITVAHQVTSGSVAPIDTEFVRTDVMFTLGEPQS